MTKTLLRSDMHRYLLSAISCLCLLHTGLCAEDCLTSVLARRETFYVPAGGSLSLSCVVQHCGDTWTGDWMWRNSTDGDAAVHTVKESVRHRLSTEILSANETRLTLDFLSVSQSDEGSYGCRVKWGEGDIDQGHWAYVNITAAVPSQRSVLCRVLVCACAFLSLPIILGLAHCLSSANPQPLPRAWFDHAAVHGDQPQEAPHPPPRRPVAQKRSTHKARPKSQQKSEVVYADISRDALRQTGTTREPAQSTVYSSVRFQAAAQAELR